MAIGIDPVIVVVGVFIGIQVANWNDTRREAQRGEQFLARIGTDLAVDIAAMDKHLAFWREVVAHGQAAIRYAETGEHVDGAAWDTVLAFYQASQLYPYVPRDTTYQEMRNAGELGLIRDPALPTALADYYITGLGFQANYLLRLEPEYRRLVRGVTPQAIATHAWAHCHRNTGGIDQVLVDCESPVSEAEARAMLDGYLAQPQLLAELKFWITNLAVSIELVENNRKEAAALAARLRVGQAP
nr:DUF6090 family protein [Luteimonas saliphila]